LPSAFFSSVFIVRPCSKNNSTTIGLHLSVCIKGNIVLSKKREPGKLEHLCHAVHETFRMYSSRIIWEVNLGQIRQHNLETDLGLHSYTLGMNQFGDRVLYIYVFFCFRNLSCYCRRATKNSRGKSILLACQLI
jgi:hypothetical protein